ncbi:MAG: DUF6115 domain-containing protein [Lachnospiraceae bacterium]|nr:DUF6115 domain-containing protein [Lachnospiraceae bacterium]
MTGLQIAMIMIGIVCLIGSFFVSEKLSKADLEEMKKMSDEEIKDIIDSKMQEAASQIDERLQEKVDLATAQMERSGEKETNEKIMAISEYSDTVLSSMNKSHDEIVFLYDMLNEKQERVTELMKELTLMQSAVAQMEETLDDKLLKTGVSMEEEAEVLQQENPDTIEQKQTLEEAFRTQVSSNDAGLDEEPQQNEQILSLYREGMSEVDIAKQLGRGLGEIKLVLGLFGEEQKHEV